MDSNFLEKEIILPPAKIDKRKKENRTPKGDNNDPDMAERSRKWCVTINNYDKVDLAKFENLECRYSMRSLGERREKRHSTHQGYVELHAAVTRKALSKRLPRASLRKAHGTRDENVVYISKNENPTFLEKGTPGAQGKRWDLDKVRNTAIYDGMKQVVTDFGFQAIRVAQLYLEYNEPCRKVKPHVAWIWGGTTTGKTSSAFKRCSVAILMRFILNLIPKRWFYGYDGHKKSSSMNSEMTGKNGHFRFFSNSSETLAGLKLRAARQFLAELIVITSPFPPEKMYRTRCRMKILVSFFAESAISIILRKNTPDLWVICLRCPSHPLASNNIELVVMIILILCLFLLRTKIIYITQKLRRVIMYLLNVLIMSRTASCPLMI